MSKELPTQNSDRVRPAPDVLRRNVVEKLAKLPDARVAQVYDFLLQIEMERLMEEIHEETAAIDLSPRSIETVKLEHRLNNPYGQ